MPVIKVGRINIGYQQKGSGPPVIFISGLSADKEHWDPVADQLKDKYDCITFDKRGNGESSAPRHGYTTADLTGDTVGLLDKLGISRAHVVGISLGGKVAMSVAFHYPERVVGLVLLGVFAGDRDARTRHWMNMRKLLQRRLNRYEYSMLAAFQFFGREAHSRPGFVEDWAKKEAEKPHPQKSYAFDQLLEEGGDFNVAEHLKDIRQPTLVMVVKTRWLRRQQGPGL